MSENEDLNGAKQELEMNDNSKEANINSTGLNQSGTCSNTTSAAASNYNKNNDYNDLDCEDEDDEEDEDDNGQSRNVRQKRSLVVEGEWYNVELNKVDEEARMARYIWEWVDAQEFWLTGDPISHENEENNTFKYMSYEELLSIKEQFEIIDRGMPEGVLEMMLEQCIFTGKKVEEKEYGLCCICKEAYTCGKIVSKLDCGHIYHNLCIKLWLTRNNTCPICKAIGVKF
ncbi:E3 ubiquitin-protein ligase CIP8-like [Impatiens glandulifera]|uniref:E3 ubiquitin-protein ligase CIP8-like n=1 Tax=Impatiens glandulifera TaxID=253017 RepID=UPI001FB1983F|nr:E3 ubiquitin-protein ligase CIP8-like [Impatiens glandulifera]